MKTEAIHFKTPLYQGVWLPFDGVRDHLRAAIQDFLLTHLGDPNGRLDVRSDGPHWIGTEVHLSYSHSQDRALLVYSRGVPLGVDIERSDRRFTQPLEQIARRFFHPTEIHLARDPLEFLDLWCKKEAYGKMTRGGLRNSVRMAMIPPPPGVDLSVVPVMPEGWIAIVCTRECAPGPEG